MPKAVVVPLGKNEEAKKLLSDVKSGNGDFNLEERDDHVLVRNVCAEIKIKDSDKNLPVSLTHQFFRGEIFIANGFAFKIN
jgi:hypothetical protein